MNYRIKVTLPNGEIEYVEVESPNQRDAHLLAARVASGEMTPPSGTITEIILPLALAGSQREFLPA